MLQSITGVVAPMLAAAPEEDKFLGFFGIDFWTLILMWGNLLILFFIVKKFLYKPVKKMLEARKTEVEETYRAAEEAKAGALTMQKEYETHLQNAKAEAEELVRTATKKAQSRSEEIVAEAQTKSAGMLKRAEEQIETEKKKAVNALKDEISGIALAAAEKVVEKELDGAEHERLIEAFIDQVE